MDPWTDNDLLRKVEQLSDTVRRKRRFQGYSGWPRLTSGILTVVAAVIMSRSGFPRDPVIHLFGWGAVLAIALLLNYGALAWWFFSHAEIRQRPASIKPALDAVPALAAGAIMSLALIFHREYNLLFGTWMLLYGLAQTTYYGKLPAGVYGTGIIYMICGTLFLLFPQPFINPWPMALMFVFGELAGGLCLMQPESE